MEKKSKKKNLIIFPGNFLPNIGGLETHVDEFVKYLSKKDNYYITIFTPNVAKTKEKETIHNGVKIIRYPAFFLVENFPFPKIWTFKFWELFSDLYHENYQIVMTRTRFFTNSTLGLFFAKFRLSRKKLIHVEHGSSFVILDSKFKSKIAYFYDMTFGKLLFKFADKNIAISKAVQKFIYRNFVRKKEKVPTIKRGVDFENYKTIKDVNLEKKFKNKIIISFVGRLFKWKGVSNTIKAYKNLPKRIQEKSVLIIGGYGDDLEKLKEESGSFLNNGIFFLGKVPFGKNFNLMKISDIHIHSAYPGGGLASTLLQYMYFENAIIASPNEGADEVIVNNQNGFLLKSNSHKEIEEKLIELIDNKKLIKKFSKNAKEDIVKNFNWNKVVENYEKEFEEVL